MTAAIERERLDPPTLSADEAEMLRAAERLLMASLDHSRAATITIESDDGRTPSVRVPPQVLQVLGRVLGLMARRQAIQLLPERSELTTVEAANFLNVSRPFVIKEIEAGRLKHRMVGTHRRILLADLVDYARRMRAGQEQALRDLAKTNEELGLGY